MDFDAIVIGGGLGGLTAGATLSKLGKKVLLLEQHYIPGGCATTFKRRDYLMEVALHEIDGPHEQDFKRHAFDLLGVTQQVQFVPVPEFYRIKTEGLDFVVPHGRDAYIQALSRAYPEEAKGIEDFVGFILAVQKELYRMPQGWKAKLLLPLFPLLYPHVLRASRHTLGSWLDQHIRNEELKVILAANLGYYHDDAYSLSLIYFCAAQSGYIAGGGYYIKGGSQRLSDYLASVIAENGGQVLLGKRVTHILTERGRATGVEYEDAHNKCLPAVQVHAPITIANAAPPLVKQMLPPALAAKLGKKIDHRAIASSITCLYIGFNKDLKKDLGNQNYATFLFHPSARNMKAFLASLQGDDWETKPLDFMDYSQLDSDLCPPGKSFVTMGSLDYMCNWEGLDEQAYALKKAKVTQIILKRLEQHFPGVVQHIEHYELATPRTLARYTANPQGTAYGYAQLNEQSGLKGFEHRSPIPGLYFASAWTNPGSGFTGVIAGGYDCAIEVNRKLKHSQAKGQLLADERVVPLLARKEIAEGTFELVFPKPKGFQHRPGQYAILALNKPQYTELDMEHRPLTIASHPDETHLRFAMRMSSSSFKRSCLAMQPGDTVTLYGPTGDFRILPTGRPVVFLTAGIGITPVMPLLHELEKKSLTRRFISSIPTIQKARRPTTKS
ncbi:MAG: FAD-dependent oxidoreductase [Sphingobacteriia bacterium]